MVTRSRKLQMRCDRGGGDVFLLVALAGVMIAVGFMVDAGRLLSTRRVLIDTAAQAATVGMQQVDQTALATGDVRLDYRAVAAAEAHLAGRGVVGSAQLSGDSIEVTAVAEFRPVMFGGFATQTVTGTSTARAVRGVTDAET